MKGFVRRSQEEEGEEGRSIFTKEKEEGGEVDNKSFAPDRHETSHEGDEHDDERFCLPGEKRNQVATR